ncbi:MAG: DUF429 domain-containing protein [Candidatus Nezhaarchaeales archaeon]
MVSSITFLGIDLAASSKRPSGYCVLYLEDMHCMTGMVRSDEEILGLASRFKPKVIAVDSPLSYATNGGAFRRCDLEARRRGFMVLPLSMPSMMKLTERGIRLKEGLERMGFKVIEVFPAGGFKALRIKSPKKGFNDALAGLRGLGLKLCDVWTVHELDAVMAAYIAYKYFKGEVEVLGDPIEGVIVIPRA